MMSLDAWSRPRAHRGTPQRKAAVGGWYHHYTHNRMSEDDHEACTTGARTLLHRMVGFIDSWLLSIRLEASAEWRRQADEASTEPPGEPVTAAELRSRLHVG